MDAAQWTPQGIGVVNETEISNSTREPQLQAEKRARPYKDQSLHCPRCNSTNTKFCYYNNYSLTQPRYFCKTCRRYWTEGGSLRNVPVGGGSRKNKRSSSSSSSSSSSLPNSSSLATTTTTTSLAYSSSTNPFQVSGQDLNLSFPNQTMAHHDQFGALELMRRGFTSSFGAGFGFQELMRQSNMKLPFDQHVGFSGSMHQAQEGGSGRVLFPFQDLKQVHEGEENGVVRPETESGLFWNGGNGRGGGTW